MKYSRYSILFVFFLIAACAAPSPTTTPTLDVPQEPDQSCTGWDCSLEGVVYIGSPSAGNELGDATVQLSQHSYCSDTAGEQEATTGTNGEFAFPVFLHDTDTFWIDIEIEGYEAVRQQIDGFDCLFCSCPPIEVVLQPTE